MLERIGFRYVSQIDPFDGGPHFEAELAEVTLVRHHRTATVSAVHLEHEAEECLVGLSRPRGLNRFRAVRSPVRFDDASVHLPKAAKELLKVKPGERVSVIPFEGG
jgi:arginine N-succinyltransferase